jgi:hypothetical protein
MLVLADSIDLYDPATIQEEMSPCVIAPCIDQAPPAASVFTGHKATLRAVLLPKISPAAGRTHRHQVELPESGKSAKNAMGTIAVDAEIHRGSCSSAPAASSLQASSSSFRCCEANAAAARRFRWNRRSRPPGPLLRLVKPKAGG